MNGFFTDGQDTGGMMMVNDTILLFAKAKVSDGQVFMYRIYKFFFF